MMRRNLVLINTVRPVVMPQETLIGGIASGLVLRSQRGPDWGRMRVFKFPRCVTGISNTSHKHMKPSHWLIELPTVEKISVELDPMSRTVTTASKTMTANMRAYSATS